MKVYSSPIPAPAVDYRNFDRGKMIADESAHQEAVKSWLKTNGYTGKRTGEIVRFQVADGYALYMLADGQKSALIHLPYGDAYQYPDVRYLPKAEILRRVEADKRLTALFKKG